MSETEMLRKLGQAMRDQSNRKMRLPSDRMSRIRRWSRRQYREGLIGPMVYHTLRYVK